MITLMASDQIITKNLVTSVVLTNKDPKKLSKTINTNNLKTVNPCTAKHKIVEIYIVYKILFEVILKR